MERSEEVRDLLLQLVDEWGAGKADSIDRFTESPGLLMIGTDPAEWWQADRARAAVGAQIQEFEDALKFEPLGRAQGFVEGTVGWAAEEFRMTSPVAADVGVRMTAVWHREADEWKLVQAHASIGVANEDSFGADLPV